MTYWILHWKVLLALNVHIWWKIPAQSSALHRAAAVNRFQECCNLLFLRAHFILIFHFRWWFSPQYLLESTRGVWVILIQIAKTSVKKYKWGEHNATEQPDLSFKLPQIIPQQCYISHATDNNSRGDAQGACVEFHLRLLWGQKRSVLCHPCMTDEW